MSASVSASQIEPSSFSRSRASVALDAVRGAAALLVLLGHWRRLCFVPLHAIPSHHGLFTLLYLVTGAGDQAVVVFFVLSGLLVGGSILRALRDGRWSWRQYLIHRMVRLWLVLLPALLLGLLWDRLALSHRTAGSGYGGAVLDSVYPVAEVAHALTLPVLLGNATFLQRILVPELGTNGALWSLANEFWYYLLFPFALFALRRHYRVWQRVIFGLAFLLAAWFIGPKILVRFPIWLAGALLAVLPRPRLSTSLRTFGTVAYLAVFFGCTALDRSHASLSTILPDTILTLATTAFLWMLLSDTEPATTGPAERFARTTAGFSYTLYVVHLPMLYLLGGFLLHQQPWTFTLMRVAEALVLLAVVLLYAWLVSLAAEAHTASLRRWVESCLKPSPSA